MNLPESDVIAADPVFQLNAIMWSLIPAEAGRYRPVLNEHGYFLHSIGRRLQIADEHQQLLADRSGYGLPSPDVLVDHSSHSTMVILECKASSFGPSSSTSQQAMKLLVGGSDVADTVGASQPKLAYLMYATRSSEEDQLWNTLLTLKSGLQEEGLPTAPAGTMVVEIRDEGVWLSLGPGEAPPEPLCSAICTPAKVVAFEEGEVPIPLYIIPWDPGVAQEPRLADLGKAILAARVLNEATAMIGRAAVPGSVSLNASLLLEAATFGASSAWRARSDVDKVESLIISRLLKWIRRVPNVEAVPHSSPHVVQLTVKSDEQRASIMEALEKVDEWAALRGPEQPELDLM